MPDKIRVASLRSTGNGFASVLQNSILLLRRCLFQGFPVKHLSREDTDFGGFIFPGVRG